MVQKLFLRPVDAIAGEAPGLPIEQDGFFRVSAEGPKENLSVTAEANGALRPLYPHVTDGSTPVLSDVVGQAIAVDERAHAAFKFHDYQARVFARDMRVQLGEFCGHGLDFAEKASKNIDQVYRRFVD